MPAKSVKKGSKAARKPAAKKISAKPDVPVAADKPVKVVETPIRPEPAAAERLAAQVEDVVAVQAESRTTGRGHEWRRLDTGWVDDAKNWLWGLGLGRALGKNNGDMAAVKEGVLAELRQIRQESNTGRVTMMSGSPFSGVLLPERARPRKKDAWKWFAGVSVALIVLLLWLGGRAPDSPAQAVNEALASVRSGNADKVAQIVDVAALSADVVNQVMAAPSMDVDVLPDAMQVHLQRDLKARMEAMIKPGLADKMAEQVVTLTREKRAPVPADGLLFQVWEDLGGSDMDVGRPVIVGESDNAAIVALPVNGADVNGVLEIALKRADDGRWRVVGVPNLSQVLLARDAEKVDQAVVTTAVAVAEMLPPVRATVTVPVVEPAPVKGRELENPADVVVVKDVAKAKQGSDTLVIKATLLNNSGVLLQHVNWAVMFADAANQPMLEIPLEMTEPLAAGKQSEQVWTVPLDNANPKARYVRDLPQEAMKVTARVVRVVGP